MATVNDKIFYQEAQPGNMSYLTNSTDLDDLENVDVTLKEMIKQINGKVSSSLKAIEDSFLMTEEQISAKAKMLLTIASKEMSDEEREALEQEASNLEKSQVLMAGYKKVQEQALTEIFSRNSGLLGNASGTLEDLQSIADKLSNMLSNNSRVNDLMDRSLTTAGLDSSTMMQQMSSAINGTSASIQQLIDTSTTQSGFSTNITKAQSNSLIGSAKRDGNMASKVASDISNSSSAAIEEKQKRLASMAKMLRDNQLDLDAASATVLADVNESDGKFDSAIDENSSSQKIQIILVKMAVQRLLESWKHYAEMQIRKFGRWNSTEAEYYDQFTNELSSQNRKAQVQYTKSESIYNATETDFDSDLRNITVFVEHMNNALGAINDAAIGLNVSTKNSAHQVGERIYQVDVDDKALDDQSRNAASREIKLAETTLESQADDILKSFQIHTIFATAPSASLVELSPVDDKADDFGKEDPRLDNDLPDDAELGAMKDEISQFESKIYENAIKEY